VKIKAAMSLFLTAEAFAGSGGLIAGEGER